VSSAEDIAVSYDLGNEFFELWLPAMSYSCGLHEGVTSEEEAQIAKIDWIADAAGVAPGQKVIDVGCGWGTCLDHLVNQRGVARADGITLSKAQYEYVRARNIPRTHQHLVDFRDFEPDITYDAVVSIGMLEHVATPEDRRTGRILAVYRDYFRRLQRWVKPGGRFGLQLVISGRIPRNRDDIRLLAWGTRTIFPGAITPRLEEVVQAAHPSWEVLGVRTRRLDYAATAAAWAERLRSQEEEIRQRYGAAVFEDYERYLSACVRMFEKGYLSLAQLSLEKMER